MDHSATTTIVTVDPRHVSYTRLMYGLHAASIVIGIASTTIGIAMVVPVMIRQIVAVKRPTVARSPG
mgnify:CR=1 FL=1